MNEAVPAVRAVGLTLDRFEDFYLAQWNRVYRPLALSLRDPDLAAEAVDEAMTRAYQRWQVVRRYENPTGWVYRVALNWARSRLRRRSREHTGLPSDRGYEHDVPDPEVHRAIAASLTTSETWSCCGFCSTGRRRRSQLLSGSPPAR